MLISEDYRELNRELHDRNPSYGTSGKQWAPYIAKLIDDDGYASVLDYGCGKSTLKAWLEENGKTCGEYDPAIAGKDAPPEPNDLVVCTDVLEHIEPVHLNALLRDLKRVTKRRLFFNIATRPAGKVLADGRNAHLIVKDAAWWREKLEQHFQILLWEERAGQVYGEAAPAGANLMDKPTKRRVAAEWLRNIDFIKREINRYADAFSRVETISIWEGEDTEPADMIVVPPDSLETLKNIDAGLAQIARLSRKATSIVVAPDELRPASVWKRIFEARFRLAVWHVENGQALMIGAPCVNVQGVVAVGAVASDTRWTQVKEATARIPRRIEPAPAHARRAIVACYGPSLTATLDFMKAEIAETGADVVSVSGAHDFLLANGIVPKFHLECDPRPHKSDNLEKPHPGVQYLIASSCHPVYFDKMEQGGADVRLWHVSTPEHAARLVDELGEKGEHVISGGGSVGLRSIPVLYAMGYRDISIYAMDCSFADGGVQQWAGKHAGKRQDVVEVMCGDRLFHSSPILLTYATNFFEMIQKVTDLDLRLYGDGLLQNMVRGFQGRAPGILHYTPEELQEVAA